MANFAISAQWFANLSRYVEQVQRDTLESAEHAVSYLHDKVVEKARAAPDWSDLADDITVWSQDGQLRIGVNNQDRVSEATALEYGDETRPPSALFRTLSEDVHQANTLWRQEMETKGYKYGSGLLKGMK